MVSACLGTIDWAGTGAMLQGWGTIGGVVAVLAAASMGFSAWKRQKLAERYSDHAEAILEAAYNGRRGLAQFRSPWMSGSELAAAEKVLDERDAAWGTGLSAERKKRLITTQAYFVRYDRLADVRTKLADRMPMARALFGDELEGAVERLLQQFWIVRNYAEAYADDWNGKDAELTAKICHALHEDPRAGQPGEVSDVTAASMETIERICVPKLRLEDA